MNFKAYFTEDDKAKIVKFLNLVAKHARFDVDTSELIDFFKHLQFMQQVVVPKVENNIVEIKQIVENKEKAAEEASKEAGE